MQRLFVPAQLLCALLVSGGLHVRDEVSADRPSRVRVVWAGGTIRVRPAETGVAVASVTAWGPEAPSAFSSGTADGQLYLELVCRLPVPCGGDLDLRLPPGVALEIDLGDGTVLLDDLHGALAASVAQGRIEARGLAVTDAVLQVVEGDIVASWSIAPERVVLATVRGDVRAALPPAAYRFEGQGGQTDLVGLEDSPGAERTISVTTVGGTARVSPIY